jgi:hypothetical protein
VSASTTDIQSALQTKLLSLVVCTTGLTTLSATAAGYARVTGSFLADQFAVGMEVTSTGFTANPTDVILGVSALTITTRNGRGAQAAGAGRSLVVGLPSLRAWENADFTPTRGLPFLEEQFMPGIAFTTNDGDDGMLERRPMYSPRVYVPSNTGFLADGRYADAIAALFAPGTQIPIASGEKLVVRGDVAPMLGQRAPAALPGWSCIPVTIALRCRTVAVLP